MYSDLWQPFQVFSRFRVLSDPLPVPFGTLWDSVAFQSQPCSHPSRHNGKFVFQPLVTQPCTLFPDLSRQLLFKRILITLLNWTQMCHCRKMYLHYCGYVEMIEKYESNIFFSLSMCTTALVQIESPIVLIRVVSALGNCRIECREANEKFSGLCSRFTNEIVI